MNRRTFRSKITKVAKMFARGVTQRDIAEELGVNTYTITRLQREHGDLLNELIAKEKATIAEAFKKETVILKSVRAAAGTDAVFDDPDRYLLLARKAARIAEKRDQPLFKSSGEETLSSFFESYYVPLMDANRSTIEGYRIAIKRWCHFSGDPPLRKITTPMLAEFKRFLSDLRGMDKVRRASPTTVRNKLRHVLSKAGPAGPRCRDAAGVLSKVPWVKLPKGSGALPRNRSGKIPFRLLPGGRGHGKAPVLRHQAGGLVATVARAGLLHGPSA